MHSSSILCAIKIKCCSMCAAHGGCAVRAEVRLLQMIYRYRWWGLYMVCGHKHARWHKRSHVCTAAQEHTRMKIWSYQNSLKSKLPPSGASIFKRRHRITLYLWYSIICLSSFFHGIYFRLARIFVLLTRWDVASKWKEQATANPCRECTLESALWLCIDDI